jgi:hypothetical protein
MNANVNATAHRTILCRVVSRGGSSAVALTASSRSPGRKPTSDADGSAWTLRAYRST